MSGKRAVALLSSVVCLIAFVASSSGQLQNAPWPMYQHDYRHTGASDDCSEFDEDLSLEWSYRTGGYMTGSPALDGDGVAYAGGDDNVFYAITSTGVIEWSYLTAGDISSSPAIDVADSIYVGSEDDRFYVFNSIGDLEWSYRTGDALESSPAIDPGGRIYTGSNDNNIYVLTSIGSLVWSYLQGDKEPSSPALDDTGRIYIGAFDNRLYAYASVGALSWSYSTGDDVESSPMVDATGYVYVGSEDSNLYAFTSGGAFEWSYRGEVSRSPHHIGVGVNNRIDMMAVNMDARIDVFWWNGARWFNECHYHANGHIRGNPFMRRDSLISFSTAATRYGIAPVRNPNTGHCLLRWRHNIPRGGHIVANAYRLVIAADDEDLIYSLTDPDL